MASTVWNVKDRVYLRVCTCAGSGGHSAVIINCRLVDS